MTVEIGRRRLVVSLRVEPVKRSAVEASELQAASDRQLARLARRTAEADRRRWESEVTLLGRGLIA